MVVTHVTTGRVRIGPYVNRKRTKLKPNTIMSKLNYNCGGNTDGLV